MSNISDFLSDDEIAKLEAFYHRTGTIELTNEEKAETSEDGGFLIPPAFSRKVWEMADEMFADQPTLISTTKE